MKKMNDSCETIYRCSCCSSELYSFPRETGTTEIRIQPCQKCLDARNKEIWLAAVEQVKKEIRHALDKPDWIFEGGLVERR